MTITVAGVEELVKTKKSEIDETGEVVKFVESQTVDSFDALQDMVVCLAEIKKAHQVLNDEKVSWTDDLKKHVKRIENGFKPGLDNLKKAEAKGKAFISKFIKSMKIKRKDLISSIPKESNMEKKQALMVSAEKLILPKIEGFSNSESWTGEVSNLDDIMKWLIEGKRSDLLLVDEKKLKLLTKNMGRDPEIPGWTADSKSTLSITVKKVLGED